MFYKYILLIILFLFPVTTCIPAEGENRPELSENKVLTRIAFGSCAKHWQPQPIWEAILNQKPDVWIFLGDNIYADTDGVTAWLISREQLQGEYNRLADKPEFQKARISIPMLATWDNHDYGSHAGGAEFKVKDESKEVFLKFWNEPENSPRWKRSGIYDARIFGPEGKRVQLILLDTKYNRSSFKKNPAAKEERLKIGKVGGYLPDNDPAKTHLGEEQWEWLEQELKKQADLRLICSSTQIIPDQKGMDEWGNFPHERKRLIDLCKKTNRAILLSGNVHFSEISQLADGSLTELTSSGMTHVNELYGKAPNKYRIAGPYIDVHFSMVEIEWNEIPIVNLKTIGLDGKEKLNFKISTQ